MSKPTAQDDGVVGVLKSLLVGCVSKPTAQDDGVVGVLKNLLVGFVKVTTLSSLCEN